ncbi:phosphodiesterase [Antarcticimicrobium sediminis]|uniref:Phosphodiesterase n=1 Tax=Antarcticimicrobium sediminis TaxID=2546227 RepID=A0A4R5ERB2_9RHOB|nr:phosphodiesterase [Antarcticimicrobium sediminis]TDE37153.1 phosphodiesterase [Antarcticimicrobium sediminis]
MLIAQISDSHVLSGGRKLAGRFDTGAAFDRLVASLARQPVRPDLILFSGDLGEDATGEEYDHVGEGLRRLRIPVLAVPGNHDARAPMFAALPDMLNKTDSGHLCLCDTRFDLAVIGLDTLVEGAPHGELCADRLSWLEAALRRCKDQDVVIFMHHPPLTTGLQDMDSMGFLAGREAFAQLVSHHGRVQGILCGHMHRAIQGACGGAPVRVAPSASHQIAFDLRADVPFAFSDEPAQYMMHIARPGEPLVSHVVSVEAAAQDMD